MVTFIKTCCEKIREALAGPFFFMDALCQIQNLGQQLPEPILLGKMDRWIRSPNFTGGHWSVGAGTVWISCDQRSYFAAKMDQSLPVTPILKNMCEALPNILRRHICSQTISPCQPEQKTDQRKKAIRKGQNMRPKAL